MTTQNLTSCSLLVLPNGTQMCVCVHVCVGLPIDTMCNYPLSIREIVGYIKCAAVHCSANHRTQEIAGSIQAKLDEYKTENKDLGRNQGVSELIILDRGFDVTSPLLHELTYQVIDGFLA